MPSFHALISQFSSFLEEITEYKNTLVPLQEVMAIIWSTVEVRKKFIMKTKRKKA